MHMYMYGAYTYKCTPEKGRSTSFIYNIMVAYAGRGSTRLAAAGVGRSCGGGGGCCTAMRGVGVQLGIVYWLLCAIYLFAALGSVVASGDSGAAAVQLAASAPALLVGAPLAAGRLVDSVVEAAVDTLAGESAEWADVVDAWCEGFVADARVEHGVGGSAGFGDRRGSNGHGHHKERMGAICDDWERKAGWIKSVEVLQRRGDLTPFTTALRQRGVYRNRFIDGKLSTRNEEYFLMMQRLRKWTAQPQRDHIMDMAAASRSRPALSARPSPTGGRSTQRRRQTRC